MWSQSVLSAALLLVLPSPELASPHLYPASTYPFGSLHQQPLHPVYYNGFYSPWNTFQPAVQAASAPAWQAASVPAWQAAPASAPARQAATRNVENGCGKWGEPLNSLAGCYKYFGGTEKKSWEAARKQCREEGYKEGVKDADLAYFETKAELDDVIELISEADKFKTTWLRGKMEDDKVKVMKNKVWTDIEKPTGIEWDGSEPVQDINTDRKLFVKKSSKEIGVTKGSYENGFLCEYKKKACEPDWVEDIDAAKTYRRCLRLFKVKKNWKNAYESCKAVGSTLVKIAPKATTKLEDLAKTTGVFGIWVNEYSVNNNLVNENGTVTPVSSVGLGWAVGYGTGTGTQRVFLNNEAKMANNDGTGLASYVCQKVLYEKGVSVFISDSENVIQPLVRSLL